MERKDRGIEGGKVGWMDGWMDGRERGRKGIILHYKIGQN